MFIVKKIGKIPVFTAGILIGLGVLGFIKYSSGSRHSTKETFSGPKHDFTLNALKNKDNLVSLAVIGSGPAGMMAGVYGARALRDTVIFEGDKPGGLLMDTTDVENWPGENAINGPDIITKLRAQAKKLGVFFLQESIESADLSQWPYRLITDNGTQLHALTVIIATGATPKRLGIPGEDENWGSGVSACAVCDAPFFKGRDVMVIGGGDSAVEEAIQLAPYVNKVTIMVRKDTMRAAASMQERLKNYANINIWYNVELQEILSNDQGSVTSVVIYDNREKRSDTVAIDGVFLAIGHSPNTAIFNEQLAMDQEGHILVTDRTQKTSVAGVFAAGDVEDSTYRQAGVAAASGIRAALDADQFLGSIGITKEYMDSLNEQLFVQQLASIVRDIPSFFSVNDLKAYEKSKDTIMFVIFYSDTCSSSAQMMPIFQEFCQENDDYLFAKVNSDAAQELVQHFFVHKVPCIFAFKNGELIGRCNGLMSKQQLGEFAATFQE